MKNLKPSFFTLVWLIAPFCLSIALILSLLNSFHPFFDSLADVRIYLAIMLLIVAAPLLFSSIYRFSLYFILFAIIILTMTWQTGGITPSPKALSNKHYTLLQANLRFDNLETHKLVEIIHQQKPDFITYQEGSTQWQSLFKQLQNEYPYQVDCPRKNSIIGSTGILSRYPFKTNDFLQCPYNEMVAIGNFDVDGQSVDVLSMHLFWPWPYRQHTQIDELATLLKLPKSENRIVAGDFNAVTWSNTVKRIEALTKTRHIGTIGPTWLKYKIPTFLRPYLGLPIDQVFVSPSIHVLSATLGAPTGSDHLPIEVIFEISKDNNELISSQQ